MSKPVLVVKGIKVLREGEWNSIVAEEGGQLQLALNTLKLMHDRVCLCCATLPPTSLKSTLSFLNEFRTGASEIHVQS